MYNKIKKTIVFVLVAIIVFSVGVKNISAATATANVGITPQTATQGGTVNVTLRVSSSVNIAVMEFYLTYDPTILEYQSGATGGGSGELRFYSDTTTKDVTYNLVFKALLPGTTTIAYKNPQPAGCGIMPEEVAYGDEMAISGGTGTITVTAPSTASSNANLSSLKVSAQTDSGSTKSLTLSPVFSATTTKYYLTLDEDIAKLVVSATTKDAKSTTSVSGTTISPGNNVTTITVTAENGGTNKYYIYSSQGDAAIDVSTEGLSVKIGDQLMQISSTLEGVDLPAGYEKSVIGYNSINVEAAVNETKSLTLIYITNADGTNGSFYIYNSEDGSFYKYQTIAVGSATYTIMKADDTVVVPDSYTRTTLTINDQEIDGWISDKDQQFGLVYAMNDLGEVNIYMYDFKEATIQRLNSELYLGLTGQGVQELEKSVAEANVMKGRLLWVVLGLSVVLVALFVLFMIMLAERKKSKDSGYLLMESKEEDEVLPEPILPEVETKPEEISYVFEEKIIIPEEYFIESFEEKDTKILEELEEKIEENTEKDLDTDLDTELDADLEADLEEETTSFEDMRSRIFEGFDDDDDDIEVVDLDEED